jgi:hypothetical protein
MANYTRVNNFTDKDSLATGNVNKRVRGSEFDAELNAISTAIATKRDLTSVVGITNGGTGAATAAAARSNLGAGTVTSVGGTGSASGLSLSGTVTTSGNLTLSGTVNSLAAGTYGINITGSAGSVAYTNVTGRPASALRQVFSGVVSFDANTSRTYTFTILYGGIEAREMPSTDSFVVVTSVNDFYTVSGSGAANTSVTKNVQVFTGTFQSKLQVTLSGWRTTSPVIYPNQVNLTIFVQDVTAVTSLTLD